MNLSNKKNWLIILSVITTVLIFLSISLNINDHGTVQGFSNSAKADCNPDSWIHCNEDDGFGDKTFLSCGIGDGDEEKNCEMVHNRKKGDVNLCCSDDVNEN